MDRTEQAGKIKSLAIVGSTASGKSALALAAAEHFGGEILSVDSMQVYRRMDIGTAKPTAAEQAAVRHHLIDICDPCTPFSAAEFAPMALACAGEVTSRGKLPIFCGGTGLYLDSLMRGGAPSETASDERVREELRAFAEQNGVHALHERLAAVDPESAEAIHENNVKRVIRALEVYLVSGKPKSAWDAESRLAPRAIEPTVIGLCYHNRDLLYARIDARVDAMLGMGLLEETARLEKEGVFAANGTAASAIGYKELLPAIRGE
ncbi:MAG: tRNA (adenosine(37)-N6)-dimethylallyltransferase MiaA, partial [Clostridia bacterium]|nr:tRNA (adenosine(37)-N6)-dimethylallyltransferase MiaA [Clostridia bacterium]